MLIRPMRLDDVPALLAVQAQCYPAAMNESAEVFVARWQACGDTAWVAADAHDAAQAYLVGYRSRWGSVSALGQPFVHAQAAQALYLHDLAIGLPLRRQGVAQALVRHAHAEAQRHALQGLALVSVNESQAFWQGQGFQVTAVDAAGQVALSSYGTQALYMTCRAGPSPTVSAPGCASVGDG